ncbi:MAG: hypothetical protein QOI90_241, partial [Mycobacterium sp.]|nr:hypothetical protein [Mycobacterium sp.]
MNTPPNVFTPAKLGPVTLRNRIIKSATFEAASPNSLVTEDLIEFHRLPAAGGVGMTTVAYLAVTPGGRTQGPVIWWRPEAIPGLCTLTEAIHAEGAAVSAQIAHAGPVADARSNNAEALAPMTSKYARAATRDDIADVVAAHATAARFAIDAGFDAVEIHLGHGYFASSFLSPLINKRDDEFGGSLQNRAKVARSVVEAVRRAVDDAGAGKIAVTAKLNMADGVDGGITVEESLQTARWLQDDGCLDAIELTAGSSLVNPMYTFRGGAPGKDVPALAKVVREYPYYDAYLLDDARLFRAELTIPLILLGGITNRETMDLAMAEGFEFIAMGRAL